MTHGGWVCFPAAGACGAYCPCALHPFTLAAICRECAKVRTRKQDEDKTQKKGGAGGRSELSGRCGGCTCCPCGRALCVGGCGGVACVGVADGGGPCGALRGVAADGYSMAGGGVPLRLRGLGGGGEWCAAPLYFGAGGGMA